MVVTMEPGGGGLLKKDSSKAICVVQLTSVLMHCGIGFNLNVHIPRATLKKQGLTDS